MVIEKMKKINPRYALALILIGAFIMRVVGIAHQDVQSDSAHYSFRALGWFDFIGKQGQTSPLVWFETVPSWAHLSFHDHPPLVSALQYIFFQLLGESSLAVYIPFVLAGVAAVSLVYLLVRRGKGTAEALLAAFLLAVASYAVWASRTGFLEGVQIVFILGALYCVIRYIEKYDSRWLIVFWGLAACALLSKYTAVFLLPAVILFLFIQKRTVFKQRNFWIGVVLFVLLLSPAIYYNFKMFQTRGHFDVALSAMLGTHPADFESIAARSTNFNIISNAAKEISVLISTMSLPFFLLSCAAAIYLIIKLIRRRRDAFELLIGLNLVFLILMFLFAGTEARYFSLIVPLLAITLAILASDIYKKLSQRPARALLVTVFALIIVGELLYAVNTNILASPTGNAPWSYSAERFYNRGFNELDTYLNEEVLHRFPREAAPLDSLAVFKRAIDPSEFIIFDDRVDWFSLNWYLTRYYVYHHANIVGLYSLLSQPSLQLLTKYTGRMIPVEGAPAGSNHIYFVYTTPVGQTFQVEEAQEAAAQAIVANLDKAGIKPAKEIKDYSGQIVFQVYNFAIRPSHD